MDRAAIALLVKWIAENVEGSSVFLGPVSSHTVDAHALLDQIHHLSGIPKETIGQWVEEALP